MLFSITDVPILLYIIYLHNFKYPPQVIAGAILESFYSSQCYSELNWFPVALNGPVLKPSHLLRILKTRLRQRMYLEINILTCSILMTNLQNTLIFWNMNYKTNLNVHKDTNKQNCVCFYNSILQRYRYGK